MQRTRNRARRNRGRAKRRPVPQQAAHLPAGIALGLCLFGIVLVCSRPGNPSKSKKVSTNSPVEAAPTLPTRDEFKQKIGWIGSGGIIVFERGLDEFYEVAGRPYRRQKLVNSYLLHYRCSDGLVILHAEADLIDTGGPAIINQITEP